MSDMGSIASALSSFNVLIDIAKAMITLRDAQAIQAKVIEFNRAMLDAQREMFAVNNERSALIERIRNLEKEIADLKAWETEKQRYEMKKRPSGSIVYALKAEMQGTEPPHEICAACYKRGKAFILQPVAGSTASAHLGIPKKLHCPECSAEIVA